MCDSGKKKIRRMCDQIKETEGREKEMKKVSK